MPIEYRAPQAEGPVRRLLHVLTGGALSVYADEERVESTFVVDRSEEGEVEIGEVWFA